MNNWFTTKISNERAQLRWKKKPSNAWDDFEAILWNMKLITLFSFTCFLFASMKISEEKPQQRCRKINTLIYISESKYRLKVRSSANFAHNAVNLLKCMNKCILSLSHLYFHSFKVSAPELFSLQKQCFNLQLKKEEIMQSTVCAI